MVSLIKWYPGYDILKSFKILTNLNHEKSLNNFYLIF